MGCPSSTGTTLALLAAPLPRTRPKSWSRYLPCSPSCKRFSLEEPWWALVACSADTSSAGGVVPSGTLTVPNFWCLGFGQTVHDVYSLATLAVSGIGCVLEETRPQLFAGHLLAETSIYAL